MRSSGPRTARPPIKRADRDAAHASSLDRGTDPGHGEDRMDRDERVARGDHDRIGSLDRLDHPGGRAGRVRAVVAQRIDLVLVASGDEPLLERERPRGRDDVRPEAIVRRGEQPRLEARSASEPGRDGGERLAAAQRLRAHEMEPEIAVAEHEPALAAPRARRLRAPPTSRRPGPSPARCR